MANKKYARSMIRNFKILMLHYKGMTTAYISDVVHLTPEYTSLIINDEHIWKDFLTNIELIAREIRKKRPDLDLMFEETGLSPKYIFDHIIIHNYYLTFIIVVVFCANQRFFLVLL